MKKADFLILIAIAALSAAPLLFLLGRNSRGTVTVTVKKDDTVIYSGDIREDRSVRIPGTGNVVTIENGKVRMSEADCRDQLCIKEGYADALHPVVCLPNRITVTVMKEETEYDAISK